MSANTSWQIGALGKKSDLNKCRFVPGTDSAQHLLQGHLKTMYSMSADVLQGLVAHTVRVKINCTHCLAKA